MDAGNSNRSGDTESEAAESADNDIGDSARRTPRIQPGPLPSDSDDGESNVDIPLTGVSGAASTLQAPNIAVAEGQIGPITGGNATTSDMSLSAHGTVTSTAEASLHVGPEDVLPDDKASSASTSPSSAHESEAGNRRDTSVNSSGAPSSHLIKDMWTTVDSLGFVGYALAIAAFIRHKNSSPPLTISVQAPWGGGKTSLMRMVQHELRQPSVLLGHEKHGKSAPATQLKSNLPDGTSPSDAATRASEGGLTLADLEQEVGHLLANQQERRLPEVKIEGTEKEKVTVWFNAWLYENTNQVWAGLVDAIMTQVPERLSRIERERFWLRLNLSRVDSGRVRLKLHNLLIQKIFTTGIGLGASLLTATAAFGLTMMVKVIPWLDKAVSQQLHIALSLGSFVLVLLATKAKIASSKFRKEPIAEVFKDLVEVPKYENELGFIHQAEKDLRRVFASLKGERSLVIFIDDIDRCSPQKVASVLEAINLFLAGDFPDCYFVIGMDAEMVAAALQASHKDMVAFLPEDARIPIGWRFMDKFVQLPFVLPPVDESSEHTFLEELLGAPISPREGQRPSGASLGSEQPALNGSRSSFDSPTDIRRLREAMEKVSAGGDDSEEFRQCVIDNIDVFGGNPREIKRFVNLYRFNYLLWYSRNLRQLPVPPKDALCRWTAMSVKWPEHVRWLRRVEGRKLSEEELRAVGCPSTLPNSSDGTNHLAVLEALVDPSCCVTRAEWSKALVTLYGLREDTSWLHDEALFRFYGDIKRALKIGNGFSEQSGKGFW